MSKKFISLNSVTHWILSFGYFLLYANSFWKILWNVQLTSTISFRYRGKNSDLLLLPAVWKWVTIGFYYRDSYISTTTTSLLLVCIITGRKGKSIIFND